MTARPLLVFLPLLAATAAHAQAGLYGGDFPQETLTCRLCERYAVITTEAPDDVGETISVVRRSGPAAAACGADPAALFTVGRPGEARYFAGMAGPHLFVDSGTGPEGRALEVFDVEGRAPVWSGAYWGETIDVEPDGRATFFVPLDDEAGSRPCPEAAAEGWGASYGYEERVRLDLRSGELERTGEVACSYRQ